MYFRKREQRKHERKLSPAKIECTGGAMFGSDDACRGVTIDVSPNGMCVYLLNAFAEGQVLLIRHHPACGRKIATVRWIKKIDDELYKAGLMFVS